MLSVMHMVFLVSPVSKQCYVGFGSKPSVKVMAATAMLNMIMLYASFADIPIHSRLRHLNAVATLEIKKIIKGFFGLLS